MLAKSCAKLDPCSCSLPLPVVCVDMSSESETSYSDDYDEAYTEVRWGDGGAPRAGRLSHRQCLLTPLCFSCRARLPAVAAQVRAAVLLSPGQGNSHWALCSHPWQIKWPASLGMRNRTWALQMRKPRCSIRKGVVVRTHRARMCFRAVCPPQLIWLKTNRERWRRIRSDTAIVLTTATEDLLHKRPQTDAELLSTGRGRFAATLTAHTQTGGNCESQETQTEDLPVRLLE